METLRSGRSVTNSCSSFRSFWATALTLAVAAIAVTHSGSALADRHCSPIQFRYYDARKALNDADATCPTRLAKALDLMREAAAEAGACGCLDAEEELETFVGNLPAADDDCTAGEQAIFELDAKIADIVTRCN